MRVLHITPNYPTPEYPIFGIFVKEQVESLEKIGIRCDVLYCDGKGRGLRQYITYLPKIWWKSIFGGYDVIHCHHALSAVMLYVTGAPLFKKVVLSYQNDPVNEWGDKWFHRFYKLFKAFIIKNPSEYLKFPNTNYLPNGCNQDFFYPMDKAECRRQLGWDQSKRYLIYMDSNKGVRTQKRRDRFEEVIKILRDKYHHDAEMIVMRNVRRDLVPIYLNAADLHMISSDFEGSPNSVKECVCCNTPIVSTDVGNVKEMIGDISGCYVIADFNAESLAEACDKVLSSDIPFNGREQFLAKGYGMSTVAQKLKDIYNSL